MDKFATLEPVRLYASSAASTGARFLSLGSVKVPVITVPLIGKLPRDIHELILSHVAVPDISAYACASRLLNSLIKDGQYWDRRWNALGIEKYDLHTVLDDLEAARLDKSAPQADQLPVLAVHNDLEDFGDFASGGIENASSAFSDFGDFVGSSPASKPQVAFTVFSTTTTPSKRHRYIRAHSLLKPLAIALSSNPPHLVLSALSTFFTPASSLKRDGQSLPPTTTFLKAAKALHLLALFLSQQIQPLRAWPSLGMSLHATIDRFDASMLAAFDVADGKGDEEGMQEAAEASWELWGVGLVDKKNAADWEMGKLWAEKREIFYEQGKWNALANFTKDNALDFDAMDEFITFVLKAIDEHGSRAVRIFPPPSQVLFFFSERIANEVLGDYIMTLLSRAREVSANDPTVFLQATAASFKEAWRIVDAILHAAEARARLAGQAPVNDSLPKEATHSNSSVISRTRAEDVVYQMFETNMDEYLDEEVELVKKSLEVILKNWEQELSTSNPSRIPPPNTFNSTALHTSTTSSQPLFLSSQNPAQTKRNVLASLTSVLLLPVTIVPRAVGSVSDAIVTGGRSLGMLNRAKWSENSGVSKTGQDSPWGDNVSKTGWRAGRSAHGGVMEAGTREDDTVFEVGDEGDEDEAQVEVTKNADGQDGWAAQEEADLWAHNNQSSSSPVFKRQSADDISTPALSRTATPSLQPPASDGVSTTCVASPVDDSVSTAASTAVLPSDMDANITKLELLLSLDVALEMIHADRESLKRMETFGGYPGHYGHRVRDSIEELFIIMLDALGRHMKTGFTRATEQMKSYKPADYEVTTSVAPLMQFFELVHIGDTIQSMVQVYFDKEMAQYIDRTDFLNPVVREKKRFENSLDDSVAGGLNAGTEVLMNQVDHIILTLTKPREYYPPDDAPLDLGPTTGCTEAIKCLEKHCKLLKGSTSKEVLEVFYQEVGIRLLAILQKHIKRQIISLSGGFQIIADLNTYHTFITSLKVASIASDFSHLKMLGHVYVVEDAKDLAQIVRDVTRYGGAYRPEDIYEFIQRRSDWKKIEKTVDKTMYNLSFKEDCVVC